ncbi:MAG: DUF4177 domain-containing protein [Candidatus Coproplasma sp.]
MKEYKVEFAKNVKVAEEIMNTLAKEGWKVISTSCWYRGRVGMTITFERDKIEVNK